MMCVCAIILVILINLGKSGNPQRFDQVTRLSEGWYYMEGNEKVYVTLPARIRQEKGEALVLCYEGLEREKTGAALTTRAAGYRLKITAGERVLYQYEDTFFPRNRQMASKVNCTARLPENFDGEKISFTYYNTNGGIYEIPEIYAGSDMAVLFYQCAKDAAMLITVFVLAVLGILAVCIAVYIKHKGVREKRFLDIACFLFFCVCWFVTDSSLAQALGGSSPMIRYISFYAFMLLAVPMLHFVKDTEGMQKYPVIDLVLAGFYINVVAQSVLNFFGVFTFVDMLFVTHLLLMAGIIAVITVLIREYKEDGSKELFTILQSFIVVAGGGALALVLYWVLRISCYEIFFECGIVVMIILLIRSLLDTMVQNLKFKTEIMVYQRLANEDIMTGMKNRRAFDTMLARIKEEIDTRQNPFLIFMDVNKLKNINDSMGHDVGDEVIIAAAKTIEKAYGKDGQCFRIGGDEFCAILMDTNETEEELSERLDTEIRRYNKTCSKYQLSVARGISSLRDEKGRLKTISDWKREADLNMYADKGWVKRT